MQFGGSRARLVAALGLAVVLATPGQATLVTVAIAGNWGVTSNGAQGADAFSGTLTYDTATLSYTNAPYSSLYGAAGTPAGSYTISWGGGTYSAAIRTIQVQQLADCTGSNDAPCVKLDMALQSAVEGYADGRFYALLSNTAPFDSVLLPDVAPSSDAALYASLSLSQATTEGRFTTLGSYPGSVPANAGATLSFGADATSAVPEPANWAMMIMGFGAVGGALRNRRRGVTFGVA